MNPQQLSGQSVTETITDEATIYCIPPSLKCRRSDNPNDRALGNWRFPNGSNVTTKVKNDGISKDRRLSSVLLHCKNSVVTPTGV